MATQTEASIGAVDPVKSSSLKRHADDSLDNEQRLSKRFHLLNIENPSKPNKTAASLSASKSATLPTHPPSPLPLALPSQHHNHDHNHSTDMQIEDTPTRIYITSLDDEIAALDSDSSSATEPALVFLPDIERHYFNTLPKRLLRDEAEHSAAAESALVLYGAPRSLSVPEERDGVRRVVEEVRARARERERERRDEGGSIAGSIGNRVEDGPVALTHDWRGMNGRGDLCEIDGKDEDEDEDAMDLG